ncbi:MAG: polysaccharide deacetylase family protein [Xanthobacteraceae bacterium]
MQYRETVKLEPKEVVLTFDDGPMPPMTNKVLDILRAECVQSTFFLIGRNAHAFPALVRTIARDGHTVAGHTQNHPPQAMGPATVLIPPKLLNELKARGYRIAHLVAAPGSAPPIAAPLVAGKPAPAPPHKPATYKKKHMMVAALELAPTEFKFVSRWRKYWETQRNAPVARQTP